MRGIAHRLLAAGTIAMSLGLGGVHVTALAGSNGQQLEITSRYCYAAEIYGYNQNGQWTDIVVSLPYYHSYVQGYWWVGTVGVDCYDANGYYAGSNSTYVPQNQPGSDWWNVAIEPNYGSNSQQTLNLLTHLASVGSTK